MRILLYILVITLIGTISISAQEKQAFEKNWIKLESENKEFSIAFPKEKLVSIQTFPPEGKAVTVTAFENGVMMEVIFQSSFNGKKKLAGFFTDTEKKPTIFDFKTEEFIGKMVVSSTGGYENRIHLASEKSYYIINIISKSKDDAKVSYIIKSITLKGKKLFAKDSEPPLFAGETVAVKDLETSSQVKEALKRKTEKTVRKISFEPLSGYIEDPKNYLIQPAFAITKPHPDFNYLPTEANKSGVVRIKLKLFADGKIGDITIYSDLSNRILKEYADSAEKIKFIPAIDTSGNYVDSVHTFWSYIYVDVGIRKYIVM